ncbi:Proprotein convertase subtilisin/kexin type 7 [Armadillidium vulgare]|nr:Proprotein convertase subtilisin/kexin type 7 [Armadillidium vulgare]
MKLLGHSFLCIKYLFLLLRICNSKFEEDQRLMGDLYYESDSNIFSLAWVVEILPNCSLKEVLSSCHHCNDHLFSSVFNDSKCNLMVVKKLEPFPNTYLIAHPYYRMYKKVRRKIKENYRKFILLKNSTSLSYNIPKDSVYKMDSLKKSNSDVYINTKSCIQQFLTSHSCVKVAIQEVLRQRHKRSKVDFKDPLYKNQWHLRNTAYGEYDVNVVGAWESGITGRGVTVCVIDDGLEWRHPDLRDNYNPRGSYDLNADDFDPSPVKNGEKNEHGTRCAGEIAAVTNHVCGVGVAYRANISGIRVLGERMTDSMEAAAFIQGLSYNDVYSCSWGPNDDGRTVDGPHYLAKKALAHGITYGRNGYGAIYVVASGNGGKNKDNCNFDGYANSAYTVTIGAVDSRGNMPYYAEECATMLAVTPSSGNNGKGIGSSKSGCTTQHSGTSAAAPLAAAVIALALEMQPCLSWRDVQYLIALTSRKIDLRNSDWIENKAGLHHSHQHGFGLMDATGMVSVAAVWESVPFSTTFRSNLVTLNKIIPPLPRQKLIVNHTVEKDILLSYALHLLEYVQVHVTIEEEYRGSLRIELICPSGTKSVLASPRINDNSSKGLQHWPLGTVRCWGEVPWGTYVLAVEHIHNTHLEGKLVSMQLVLHGSPMTDDEFMDRKRMVKSALRGEVVHVNRSQLCHIPEPNFEPYSAISDQVIKVVVLSGIFLFLMGLYNTFEYILCYNNEKRRFYQHIQDMVRIRSMMLTKRNGTTNGVRNGSTHSNASVSGDPEESQNLLETRDSSVINTEDSRQNVNSDHRLNESCLIDIHHNEDDFYERRADRNLDSSESPYSANLTMSPTPSCEADISSLNLDSDDDNYTILSGNTSGTIIPRETDLTTTTTDFTTDHTSEADELDKKQLFKNYS